MSNNPLINNSFYDDLARSRENSKKPFWGIAYRAYFGDEYLIEELIEPMPGKKDSGADKIIRLNNGQEYKIDEKYHGKKGFKDDKIHFELWHVFTDGRMKPGWGLDRDKNVDYLAYSKEDTGQVFIFPFKPLQQAWELHGSELEVDFKETSNGYYVTRTALVSAQDLLALLGKHSVVHVAPEYWN